MYAIISNPNFGNKTFLFYTKEYKEIINQQLSSYFYINTFNDLVLNKEKMLNELLVNNHSFHKMHKLKSLVYDITISPEQIIVGDIVSNNIFLPNICGKNITLNIVKGVIENIIIHNNF